MLDAEQARQLLDSIDTTKLSGSRDRALIAVMVFSFARVSAAISLKAEDYYQDGKRWWFRFREKGGKQHQVPAHHTAEAYLDSYLFAAQIAEDKKAPLFRLCHPTWPTYRPADDSERRPPHGETPSGSGRIAAHYLQSHLSGHRYHHLPAQRRNH